MNVLSKLILQTCSNLMLGNIMPMSGIIVAFAWDDY